MKNLCLFLACLLGALSAEAMPPGIVAPPKSISVNSASSAVFAVIATNAATYQWFFQGSNLLAGATNPSLTLNDVSANDAGSYTVVVTSSDNFSVSNTPPAVLTILQGTIIQWTVGKFADGSSNSFLVQLFDHDKPATTANFIHYITSGAYSNIFFDTDSNYVLQAGDFATPDRLASHLQIQSLAVGTNIFPAQIISEFSLGAVVPNAIGTLAARESGHRDASAGSFFFNLTDNSANLDPAGYTVFGRILSNSAALQYFAALSAPGDGINTNASSHLNALPVNYSSTNKPTDANLFYCDFQFVSPSNAPVDSGIPTVFITSPAPNAALTNGFPIAARGTAQDAFALAEVYCVLSQVSGEFPTATQTIIAQGTTNWSLSFGSFEPGIFQLTAYAQDAGGALSAPVTVFLTNQAILTIITNVDGALSTNAPIYLTSGQQYSFAPEIPAGEMFVEWQNGGVPSLEAVQTFTAEANTTLEVICAATNPAPGLAIASPPAGSVVQAPNGNLVISGAIPSPATVTQLTVQLFSQSTSVTAALPAIINGTNWSLAETNLVGGPYAVVVVASGPAGQAGLLEEQFTALTGLPVILSGPQSAANNTGSAADFSVTSSNAVSYQWQQVGIGPIPGATNALLELDNLTLSQSGSAYQVVLTAPDGETVTSTPPAVLTVLQSTVIQWTISTYPGGGSNSFLVQLFDHDKPATVENFIHYITSGVYSNMFFDRDITNFVLQGGDYASVDRSTTNRGVNFIVAGGAFPAQLASEFNTGPLIHNEFGTLAMALQQNSPNSASSAFFFNLTNNSASLDAQEFTVFGRILTGSNVLQYFDTLSPPSNGIFPGFSSVPNLPVNYNGANDPADANFFYCDFAFQTPAVPPVDTNIPSVSISAPLPGALYTNAGDLTATGTAQGYALADVYCVLTPLTGADAGEAQTNAASGTLDWSLDLGANPPGIYELTAYAQDGGGNLSAPVTQYFTNFATLTIITNDAGTLSTNVQYLLPGQQISAVAAPGSGEVFVNWNVQGTTSLSPAQTFTLETSITLEVAYNSTNFPPGLAITSPSANSSAQTANSALTITGTIPSSVTVTAVTVQLFANSNALTAPLSAVINGTNWSLTESNLAGGPYFVTVSATDSLYQEGFVSENFTALIAPPVIISLPQIVTVNAGSSAVLAVTASNAISYQWLLTGSPIDGATNSSLVLNDVSASQSGSAYEVVLTSRDTQVVTSHWVVLTVETGTFVQLTVSKYADGTSNTIQVELFDHDKPATVANFIHYAVSGAYSNMFFDTVSNGILQGGNFAAPDRAANHFDPENLAKGTNLFPSQIPSEFNLGAVVSNTFGTLAAQESVQRNAGTGSFFFNLADNSTNLDALGYTVFGRILSGSNVLQYFTTLNAPSNGIYTNATSRLNSLPVNYSGTNKPADANLFYCDIQFISPSTPVAETATPTVAITSPAPNAALTNGGNVTVRGTAQDSFELADVYCVLNTVAGSFTGGIQTNIAQGGTNWSVAFGAIQAGVYQLTACAQDAGGALSAPVTEYFTNLAILTIVTNVDGKLTAAAPQYLTPGQQYSFSAPALPGGMFVDWQNAGVASLNPVQTIIAGTNATLTAIYAATSATPGLAMNSPAPGSVVQAPHGNLAMSGVIPSSTTVTQLTVQLFSQFNAATAALPAVINGTNWSVAESNLVGGPYTAVVVAAGASNQVGLLEQTFTALTVAPVINSQPQNQADNAGSSADFNVQATNVVSYQWLQVGVGPIAGATNAFLGLNDLSLDQSGSAYQVVLTAADGETLTSAPPAVLTVVQGTIIQCTAATLAGGSDVFQVELFDQDKPATVENFLHFITSGVFSNTFFDTDFTNSLMLGGDFVSTDRAANHFSIHQTAPGAGFPTQIDSEFNFGPFIPNSFGTLASLSSANPGYGTAAFVINLTNNSPDFDARGYAVFGRIISGTAVLQYFNGLSLSNGLYADTNDNLPALPVNYSGASAPVNANLLYCNFQLVSPSNAPVYTNIPSVTMTFPANGAAFTNLSDLTVTGTASGVGLAEVYCVLSSLEGSTAGESGANHAQGTTNWSLDFGSGIPGIFEVAAYAEDGAGNVSPPVSAFFTNLAQLTIITNNGGVRSTNGPQYLVPGTQETVTAAPGPGQQFYNWTVNGVLSINPVQKFTLSNNFTLVVTYLPTNASPSVTITTPAAGKGVLAVQSVLDASGTLAAPNATQLTCQFFSNSNAVTAALPAIITGTNWSLAASKLSNGKYTMVAVAANALGPIASASVNFSLTNVEMLTLATNGQGTIVNTNAHPYLTPGLYTVKAVPAKGWAFYNWSDGVNTSVNPADTFRISSNLTLTATFVPSDAALTGIAITYPPANAMLTNGTFLVKGTVPHSQVFTRMTCQLFLQSATTNLSPQPVTINATGAGWSFPVSNLTAGPYTIVALATDAKGDSKLVASSFNLLSKLTVNVQGLGTVTPGMNGKYLQVGKSYSITGTPKPKQIFAFWTGSVEAPLSPFTAFVMSPNLVLTATFTNNPFPAVAGVYSGLFFNPAAVSPTNAGSIRLTVSTTGSFSGSLVFPSVTYSVSYAFPYTGQAVLPAPPDFYDPSNRLQLSLNIDLTNGADAIEGFLGDQTPLGNYIWISRVNLNRNVTKLPASNAPPAGHCVVLEQPADAPIGSVAPGYGAESLLTSGALTFTGALPDNAAIFEAASISKDGVWPVYIVPAAYARKGLLIGWQTNSPLGACGGQLYWCKPGAGAAANLSSSGAAFAAPAANSQYQMALASGAVYPLPVNKLGHFAAQAPITSISLLTTGVLAGLIESNKTSMSFKGAFISPSQGGAGFVVEPGGHTEGFQIMLVP
ncbi:MAG TPA: peptidylprolyl isomerase [Verrucomicrobiae bacterium]|jgi:cyclophilin family peptidyl-prolyl cis-trans isomerase